MMTYSSRQKRLATIKVLDAVRVATSNASFDLRAAAPAGATHVEFEAIGGGASGVALAFSSNLPSSHGGFPGLVLRSPRLAIADLPEIIEILVGAGGAAQLPLYTSLNDTRASNAAGGASIVRIAGVFAPIVAASGGPSHWFNGELRATPAELLGLQGYPYLPSVPGAGFLLGAYPQTSGNTAGTAAHGPGAGGGSTASTSANGGSGGLVRHQYPLSNLGGGNAQFAPNGQGDPTVGGYGSGGAGARRGGPNAGSGGFPGGGGGGGYGNMSGAGGNGAVDIYFYGVA